MRGILGDVNSNTAGGKLTLDSILKAMEAIKGPPIPRGLRTSHSVPYGRVFRQWDTRGDLWLWVSRGQVEDMPHIDWNGIAIVVDADLISPAFGGIPVYHDE